MRIELEAIEGEREAYSVIAVESDGGGKRMTLGTVTRRANDEWGMKLGRPGSAEPATFILQAPNVETLRGVIRDRFALQEVPADRLSSATAQGFFDEVLRTLSALATQTDSLAAFTSALVMNIAVVGAVDIKPEGREDYVIAITQRLRAALAEQVTEMTRRDAVREHVRDALDNIMRKPQGGGDEPLKH